MTSMDVFVCVCGADISPPDKSHYLYLAAATNDLLPFTKIQQLEGDIELMINKARHEIRMVNTARWP